MLQLVDEQQGSSDSQRYKYRKQELSKLRWLWRDGRDGFIPIVEKPGAFYDKYRAFPDMADLDRRGFISFVNGNHWKEEKGVKFKVPLDAAVYGEYEWRVRLTPPDFESRAPLVWAKAPFAPLVQASSCARHDQPPP